MFGCCKKNEIEARVVDGSLVLSIQTGEHPALMRFELDRLNTAALEVGEDKDGALLMLKEKNGDAETIARFDGKKQAAMALSAVSHALMAGAEGHPYKPVKKGGFFRTLGKIIFVLLLLFVVFVAVVVATGPAQTPVQMQQQQGSLQQQMPSQSAVPATPRGTPESADSFFGGGQ